MQYCLDTNVIIDFFRNDPCVTQKMQDLEKQNIQFLITSITLSELWRGAYLAPKKNAPIQLIKDLLLRVEVLPLSGDACKIYGEKFAELKKQGKLVEDFDLLIGSSCIAQNTIFITRNPKHFKNIKDLTYIVW
jgi:tRNA(fMet)-specific endonuclease VapC